MENISEQEKKAWQEVFKAYDSLTPHEKINIASDRLSRLLKMKAPSVIIKSQVRYINKLVRTYFPKKKGGNSFS